MDPLMFDTHQYHPEWIVPINWHHQGHLPDRLVHNASYGLAIRLDLGERRPVVVRSVEIIPGHLIHPNREHGFKSRIDTGADESGNVDDLVKSLIF